jgi:two-component system cell cycle sensor histidine kinase/response regulator CckA
MSDLTVPTLCGVLDGLREPIFIIGPAKRVLFANPALYAFLGLPYCPDQAPVDLSEFWPAAANADVKSGESAAEFLLASGDRFSVRLAVTDAASGSVVRVLSGISRNEKLHNFKGLRLETLGMLAGGVAHDFNNVLAGILGHVSYLKTILPARGDHVESLTAIEDGAKKATALTKQILGYAKIEEGEKVAAVDVCDVLRSLCKLLRGAISTRYILELALPKDPLQVLAVEGKIAQVLVNLIINARDAIKSEGIIRVSAAAVSDQNELVAAFAGADRGSKNYMRLSVEDNGAGIPKEIQSRIFEPYFSTKKEKGTGLGLAVVREIVELFGGAIVVDSKLEVGTRISVYWPLVATAAADVVSDTSAVQYSRHAEKVLVIDDEYSVRNVLMVGLQHLGYEVETASNGPEGIAKFKQAQFDLVLLDMIMPQQSGDEVFFELKRLDPSVKVLVISGFSSETAVQAILTNGGLDFLQKPFTIEELSKRVKACLS